MTRWIFFFVFTAIVEFYAFQAVKTGFENKWVQRVYLLISLIAFVFLVYSFSRFDRSNGQNHQTLVTLGLFLLIYIPKLLITVFLLVEDVFRLFIGAYQYFSHSETSVRFLPERRKFISTLALGVAAILFASIIYGIFQGRFNYKVIKQPIYFDDLPDEFDGFTLLQLSDIHSGSFDNPEKIKYGIDLINEQDFDLFVFTGDLVNTHGSEMDNWVELFSLIKK